MKKFQCNKLALQWLHLAGHLSTWVVYSSDYLLFMWLASICISNLDSLFTNAAIAGGPENWASDGTLSMACGTFILRLSRPISWVIRRWGYQQLIEVNNSRLYSNNSIIKLLQLTNCRLPNALDPKSTLWNLETVYKHSSRCLKT